MLILSRKNRESVVIGGTDAFSRLFKVTVLILRVAASGWASRSIQMFRSMVLEVWERIQANGRDRLSEGSATSVT